MVWKIKKATKCDTTVKKIGVKTLTGPDFDILEFYTRFPIFLKISNTFRIQIQRISIFAKFVLNIQQHFLHFLLLNCCLIQIKSLLLF